MTPHTARLLEALRFYANASNWKATDTVPSFTELDLGAKAREVLADLPPEPAPTPKPTKRETVQFRIATDSSNLTFDATMIRNNKDGSVEITYYDTDDKLRVTTIAAGKWVWHSLPLLESADFHHAIRDYRPL